MRGRFYIGAFVLCLSVFSACTDPSLTNATIIPPSSEGSIQTISGTTAPTDASITAVPMSIDVSFDEILGYYDTVFELDLATVISEDPDKGRYVFDTDEHHIVYISDYSAELDYLTSPDPVTGSAAYFPEEYEYHVTRRLKIDEICVDEFDDVSWAMDEYITVAENILGGDVPLEESRLSEGYFYAYNDRSNGHLYHAGYFFENCTVFYSYSFDRDAYEDYGLYYSMSEELGLPTCSTVNDEIGVDS